MSDEKGTENNEVENTEVDEVETDPRPVTVMPDDSPGFLLAERVCYYLLAIKGEDVVVLDLRGLSDVCDFFVLGSGQATVQVQAMAKAVRSGLLEVNQKTSGSEGENEGRWILLDFVDVVVHVLKPEVREYYQLERLWDDAPALVIDPEYLQSPGFAERHPDLAANNPPLITE